MESYYYNQEAESNTKVKWWAEPEEEMYRHINGVVNRIKEAQKYRETAYLNYLRLYNNVEILGLGAGQFARAVNQQNVLQNYVSYNVVKSCVDTAAAKVAKAKPRPYFLTDGGHWTLQRRAMKLTKYLEGLFDSIGTGDGDNKTMYGLARRSFIDAAVCGLGVTKIFRQGTNVRAERVFPSEIIVDEIEGRYEMPRQLHHETLAFREILMEQFPEHASTLASTAPGVLPGESQFSTADVVRLIESWHLPSSDDANDGKRVLSVGNCTLLVEDYKKSYFPFAFQRWSPRLLGFFGTGLAEELIGIQLEINKLLRKIHRSIHLMSSPQVWLDYGSKAVAKHMNNDEGSIHFYTGKQPLFLVPQAMSAEVYNHLENLYRKAYEITGISQLSASSRKPAGIDAAVALRELQDIESERFQLVSERYNDYFLDVTKKSLDILDDIAADGYNPAIRLRDNDYSYVAKWKDVSIPKDQYTLRIFPASLLPTQPAGKLQKVQELLQAGFLDREEALELLEFPDTKSVVSVKVADRRELKKQIEAMIDKAEYSPPEPFSNLTMARSLAQSYYNAGKADSMPEDRLELLRRYMEDVQALIDAQTPPQQTPMMPLPGAEASLAPPSAMPPLASPEAPPVSDLIPINS